jgi:hypothetical protein
MPRKAYKTRSDKGILRGHSNGSQADMILKRLKEGHPISSWTAIQRYGCTRLASIIFNLKKEGYDIKTTIIKDGTKKFARYKLKQELKF